MLSASQQISSGLEEDGPEEDKNLVEHLGIIGVFNLRDPTLTNTKLII